MKNWIGIALLFTLGCQLNPNDPSVPVSLVDRPETSRDIRVAHSLDKEYWYSGQAEISKYELSQNRYREIHPGEVIMIFVTEDFLTDKQVKNDHYQNPNSISVLKTNQLRRFTTGIYDYSMMTSVFTPADGKPTLKVTLSSQDWCGQSFIQLNKEGREYLVTQRSYFESEGDENFKISADLLEDEIFNRIRINPSGLPQGPLSILPSLTYLRLSHEEAIPRKANASLSSYSKNDLKGENLKTYEISYDDLERKLSVIFEAKAPYKIVAWQEAYPSAIDKKLRLTTATKQMEIRDSYWTHNHLSDNDLRLNLKVTGFND